MSRFVYGDKATTPELVIQGSAVYRVISDHLGSVRALVNIADAQDVPVRLEYEAFGSVSGTGVGVIPQGFAGGLYDADTVLVRFGKRDYDPRVGRWTAKDPIRWQGGQTDLYIYVWNDPINGMDPSGLHYGSAEECGAFMGMSGAIDCALVCSFASGGTGAFVCGVVCGLVFTGAGAVICDPDRFHPPPDNPFNVCDLPDPPPPCLAPSPDDTDLPDGGMCESSDDW